MGIFNQVQVRKPGKNKFNLSHERKLSLNMGDLVPILVQEVVPGDVFRVKSEIMMRLAPMLAPIMHRCDVWTHFFEVPARLCVNPGDFEKFIYGGEDGLYNQLMPFSALSEILGANAGLMDQGSLADYMGLPSVPDSVLASPDFSNMSFNMSQFRAYQLIYNEYYRDQTLQPKIDFSLSMGSQDATEVVKLMTMRKRCWEKDAATSALPFSQRGPVVDMPVNLSGYMPVVTSPVNGGTTSTVIEGIEQPGAVNVGYGIELVGAGELPEDTDLYARVDELTTGTSIIDLRRALKLQEYLEKNAVGGSRLVEGNRAHFGVKSSDARMQRPIYLGGARNPIVISEVLSSVQQVDEAGDPIGTPQGDMSGHGYSAGSLNGFKKHFVEEQGWIIGIMSVLPRTAYQQGVPRQFFRTDKTEWYWPSFALIGEQEVQNREVYFDGTDNGGDPLINAPGETWGYQMRYHEMKAAPNTVHGDFRTSLAYWHMGRIFSSLPPLNEAFVEADPTHRIFAVDDPTKHKLWCQIYNRVDAIRPMPYFGTPTL